MPGCDSLGCKKESSRGYNIAPATFLCLCQQHAEEMGMEKEELSTIQDYKVLLQEWVELVRIYYSLIGPNQEITDLMVKTRNLLDKNSS